MKDNLLNHFVDNRFKSLEQNLSCYIESKNPEFLHSIRVDIKKLRAIFSFANDVYNEKYELTNLKPLFDKAGKIREKQINIKLLNEFPQPPQGLITELKKKENSLIRKFIDNGSRYIRLIKNIREKVSFSEIMPDKKLIKKQFEKEKQKAIKKLENKDRIGLHQYRMKIKKMMYVYNALPKKLQREIELNEEEINEQQKKLGDWHDLYSTIHSLSNKYFPKKTIAIILKMKEKERRQFNSLLKYPIPFLL